MWQNSKGVDLVVIGTRGLDKPKRFFLGSVSSGVVTAENWSVFRVKFPVAIVVATLDPIRE
ncbi:MAG: universal stress protein [Nitrososphaerales archaeon]